MSAAVATHRVALSGGAQLGLAWPANKAWTTMYGFTARYAPLPQVGLVVLPAQGGVCKRPPRRVGLDRQHANVTAPFTEVYQTRPWGRVWPLDALMVKKNVDVNDADAGRSYMSAHVGFVHYVERLYDAAETLAPQHAQKAKAHAH